MWLCRTLRLCEIYPQVRRWRAVNEFRFDLLKDLPLTGKAEQLFGIFKRKPLMGIMFVIEDQWRIARDSGEENRQYFNRVFCGNVELLADICRPQLGQRNPDLFFDFPECSLPCGFVVFDRAGYLAPCAGWPIDAPKQENLWLIRAGIN